ncbi:adenylate/guanylate cyclase domain-containing protein, partial [Pyxidicoccus sp. 3LFB2]
LRRRRRPQSSGTAVFGAAPNGYSPSTSAPMAPVAMRTGTAAFGTRTSGSVPTVTGGASVVKPQNLTVMLTDIQGFTERTSRQTHEENARMLETHDRLLMPLVKEHEGRLVQKRGDALLVVFRSPTAGVLCGMAMQDRLWRHNQTVAPEEQLHVRVCLHAGEVLLTADTVLGEPMEVVESVEHVAAAGEVTFTEAVNLARNRAEATAEPCGTITLPGREEQLQLYRCQRAAEGPPFGNRFVPASGLGARLSRVFSPLVARLPGGERLSGASRRLSSGLTALRTNRTAQVGLLVGALAMLGGGTAWLVHRNDPVVRAYALLEEGNKNEAQERLEAVPEEEQKEPSWQRARAAVYHAKNAHKSEYFLLSKLDDAGRARVEPPVLDGLAEDYGRGGGAAMEALLDRFPKETVLGHFEDLAEEEYSLRQWGALRYLEYAKATASVDLVDAYSRALASEDCDIRAQAAVRLEGLGDPDAIPALTRVTKLPKTGLLGASSCGHTEAGAAIKTLSKRRD